MDVFVSKVGIYDSDCAKFVVALARMARVVTISNTAECLFDYVMSLDNVWSH